MKWNNLVLNDASFIARLIAEWDHQRLSKIEGDRPAESWASCSPIRRMAGSNEGDGVIDSPETDELRLDSVYRLDDRWSSSVPSPIGTRWIARPAHIISYRASLMIIKSTLHGGSIPVPGSKAHIEPNRMGEHTYG